MSKPNIVWTPCGSCDRDTKHEVLSEQKESHEEYLITVEYQIVECCGCETKSFRHVVNNYEDAYQISEDEWEVPKDVTSYPSVLKGHQGLPGLDRVPDKVANIYLQSLEAIKCHSTVLAGIGLRATIEAICNDQNVVGKNLVARIDKLAKAPSLISQLDADRLHAIRFLGNDAAHDVEAAKEPALIVALRVVEHLIVSLYVLDADAEGVLETVIKDYAQFEALLVTKVGDLAAGTELPLFKILEGEYRRFHGYIKTHETELINKITSGAFTQLQVGKLDKFAGSSEKFQHFIVA